MIGNENCLYHIIEHFDEWISVSLNFLICGLDSAKT